MAPSIALTVEEELYLLVGCLLTETLQHQVCHFLQQLKFSVMTITEGIKRSAEQQIRYFRAFWGILNALFSYISRNCSEDDALDYIRDTLQHHFSISLQDAEYATLLTQLTLVLHYLEDNERDKLQMIRNGYRNRCHFAEGREVALDRLNITRITEGSEIQHMIARYEAPTFRVVTVETICGLLREQREGPVELRREIPVPRRVVAEEPREETAAPQQTAGRITGRKTRRDQMEAGPSGISSMRKRPKPTEDIVVINISDSDSD